MSGENQLLGYNPMRWDCSKNGCFNLKKRPKIEVFASCFPGRINFGDVDGLVEISGKFCLLEWKSYGGTISRGQEMTYVSFTKIQDNVVFIVNGDAETMNISECCIFWEGRKGDWRQIDLKGLQILISRWANHVAPRRCSVLE